MNARVFARLLVNVGLPTFFLLATGCDNDRQDAATVLSAIHRFRTAPNESLPAMVDALKTTPCKAAEVCQARDECVTVGEMTAKALRLKTEVEQGLADLDAGKITVDSPEALSFEKKLDDASAALKAGHDGLPRCDAAVQSLKRRYSL